MCFPLAKKTEFGNKIGNTWRIGKFNAVVFPPPPDWEPENEEPQKQETPRYILYFMLT